MKVEAGKHRACFSSPGAFKTYDNLCEGRNQGIPIQSSVSGEGPGKFLCQVRAVPELQCGQSEM
jgi:hypothetical protein